MIPKDGKLLTAEKSLRLAICDSVEKDKLIAGIVGHLRKNAHARQARRFANGRPRDWYAVSVRP